MRNMNTLYGGSGVKTTSLNPSGKPPSCGDKLELPPSRAQVQESLSTRLSFIGSGHPPTLQDLPLSLCQQRMVQLSPKTAAGHSEEDYIMFCRYRGNPLFLGNLTLNFQALWSAVFPSWSKYYSTCKDNRASVTENTITIALLMIHEYTRTKYAFSLILSGTGFSILVLLGNFSTLTPNS